MLSQHPKLTGETEGEKRDGQRGRKGVFPQSDQTGGKEKGNQLTSRANEMHRWGPRHATKLGEREGGGGGGRRQV